MTRFNTIHVLISSAIILAAIGCGDANSLDTTDPFAEGASPSDESSAPAATELEFACEAFCDTAVACRGTLDTEDCAESCETRYTRLAEDDGDCAAAQIDLLNCHSALDCDASGADIRSECDYAIIAVSDACGTAVLRHDIEEDGVLELVEVGDHEWIDVDDGVEETDETDASDDEESDETDDTGPIDLPDLPDFPEFPEIPEIGPVIDFP